MMPDCPYGTCTMVNLCIGDHCVRAELEKNGYTRKDDGTLERIKPPSEYDE